MYQLKLKPSLNSWLKQAFKYTKLSRKDTTSLISKYSECMLFIPLSHMHVICGNTLYTKSFRKDVCVPIVNDD